MANLYVYIKIIPLRANIKQTGIGFSGLIHRYIRKIIIKFMNMCELNPVKCFHYYTRGFEVTCLPVKTI